MSGRASEVGNDLAERLRSGGWGIRQMPMDDRKRQELQRLRNEFLEVTRVQNDAVLFDDGQCSERSYG